MNAIPNINADNITEISLKAAFNKAASKDIVIPTAEEHIKHTIKLFNKAIKGAKTEKAAKRILTAKHKYKEIIEGELPEGYALVPVLMHPKEPNSFEASREEYRRSVSKDFVKFIAKEYGSYMEKQGVSKYITRIMEKGLLYKDAFYVSCDHIFERRGSGTLGTTETDNKYLVNNFNNLKLISHKIHKLKNNLRSYQEEVYNINEMNFFLMLTPINDNTHPDFININAQNNEKLFGVRKLNDFEVTQSIINGLEHVDEKFLNDDGMKEAMNCVTDELNHLTERGEKAKLYSICNMQAIPSLRDRLNNTDSGEAKILANTIKSSIAQLVTEGFNFKRKPKKPQKVKDRHRNRKSNKSKNKHNPKT